MPIFLLFALAACSGSVKDGTVDTGNAALASAASLPGCPSNRRASEAIVPTMETAAQLANGIFRFCHGERAYTGRGELTAGVRGEDGLELRHEDGKWKWWHLGLQNGSLARVEGLAHEGWIEPLECFEYNGDHACDVILRAEDGHDDTYFRMKLWDDPIAIRSDTYDIYDYVKIGD